MVDELSGEAGGTEKPDIAKQDGRTEEGEKAGSHRHFKAG